MTAAAWHARIECGRDVGAGFLVADRLLLTCAHVVREHEDEKVTVYFPGRGDLGDLPARVVHRGGWSEESPRGDLAVVELERPVSLRPAVLAPPEDTDRYGRGAHLIAYGFPVHFDEGTLARYQAVPGPLIADEWVQLEALSAHGQTLQEGFSGAGVALADGTVVGMVTSTAGEHVGRMLPVAVLARHWPGLEELLSPDRPGKDAPPWVHALVRRVERDRPDCDPHRLYTSAMGPFDPQPEQRLPTLRAALEYVQREVQDPRAMGRFTDRLRRALVKRPPAATSWSPIVVELGHSGAGPDQVTVEVFAYRDGRRRRVHDRRLPLDAVPAYVREHVDAAFTHLDPDAEVLLAFVLPSDLLNEPVAGWQCRPTDPTPFGIAHPLVVTERERLRSGQVRHALTKKWQRMDARPGVRLHRVDCDSRENTGRLRLRLQEETTLAGFAAHPDSVKEHFATGLNLPVPVLLWSRTGCADDDHDGPCSGAAFLDRLSESVDGVPAAELPRVVKRLRQEAYAADDPEGHWAREVQLLWDDPRCFPEPAAASYSPVG
ncbi:trypsin-like peptidase domain-containing protein [Streptomyces sp. CRN 30]|uniref:VMAP-C domain-containing protein n=1 Tax=Streptomyces sp. CRN 30 TaxID=3075613 RepID=UPI002A807C78|nr:trypsin-like peptidase domain-containing protein [Streptomyces sp. CRN 30]